MKTNKFSNAIKAFFNWVKSSNHIKLITEKDNTNSNIRMQDNIGSFDLHGYSTVTLHYYGGYWYCPMDRGQ